MRFYFVQFRVNHVIHVFELWVEAEVPFVFCRYVLACDKLVVQGLPLL